MIKRIAKFLVCLKNKIVFHSRCKIRLSNIFRGKTVFEGKNGLGSSNCIIKSSGKYKVNHEFFKVFAWPF